MFTPYTYHLNQLFGGITPVVKIQVLSSQINRMSRIQIFRIIQDTKREFRSQRNLQIEEQEIKAEELVEKNEKIQTEIMLPAQEKKEEDLAVLSKQEEKNNTIENAELDCKPKMVENEEKKTMKKRKDLDEMIESIKKAGQSERPKLGDKKKKKMVKKNNKIYLSMKDILNASEEDTFRRFKNITSQEKVFNYMFKYQPQTERQMRINLNLLQNGPKKKKLVKKIFFEYNNSCRLMPLNQLKKDQCQPHLSEIIKK